MYDETVFDDMVARIVATGKFRKAEWGRIDEPFPSEGATALIQRIGFKTNQTYSGNMSESERIVTYHITLDYYNSNTDTRRRRMLRYEAILVNLFNCKSLGGITQPQRTLLETGTDDNTAKIVSGQSRTVLVGSFTYLVKPTDGIDVGVI